MEFQKTFKTGDTLTVTIEGTKALISLNGIERGARFQRVGKNDRGVAWGFDNKYGLTEQEMNEIKAVLAEANKKQAEVYATRTLTRSEKAEKEYCEHYDRVTKAMSY